MRFAYRTSFFAEAAKLSLDDKLAFLNALKENRFFRPDQNARMFSEILGFCFETSGRSREEFSASLFITPGTLLDWRMGRNLPYPIPRKAYANTSIDIALLANGWIGTVPAPPVHDGSNIICLTPRPR